MTDEPLPPEIVAEISRYATDSVYLALLCTSKSARFYMEAQRPARLYPHVCRWLLESRCSLRVFLPRYTYLQEPVPLDLAQYLTQADIERWSPPTEGMLVAAMRSLTEEQRDVRRHPVFRYLTHAGLITKPIWMAMCFHRSYLQQSIPHVYLDTRYDPDDRTYYRGKENDDWGYFTNTYFLTTLLLERPQYAPWCGYSRSSDFDYGSQVVNQERERRGLPLITNWAL